MELRGPISPLDRFYHRDACCGSAQARELESAAKSDVQWQANVTTSCNIQRANFRLPTENRGIMRATATGYMRRLLPTVRWHSRHTGASSFEWDGIGTSLESHREERAAVLAGLAQFSIDDYMRSMDEMNTDTSQCRPRKTPV